MLSLELWALAPAPIKQAIRALDRSQRLVVFIQLSAAESGATPRAQPESAPWSLGPRLLGWLRAGSAAVDSDRVKVEGLWVLTAPSHSETIFLILQ